MPGPSKKTPTERTQIVLSVLRGEYSIAETARRHGVSEQAVGNWKRQFLAGGAEAMQSGGTKATSREERIEYENNELKTALGEAHVELRVWKKGAEYLPPSRTSR